MTLRERILNAKDIQEEKFEVKEWGCEVLIRGLTGKQRATLLQSAVNDKGGVDFTKVYPQLLLQTVYDPQTGKQAFEVTDADGLMEKSGAAIESVAQVAMRLSGLSKDAAEAAEKKSSAASAATTSASPSGSVVQ